MHIHIFKSSTVIGKSFTVPNNVMIKVGRILKSVKIIGFLNMKLMKSLPHSGR